MCVAGGVEDNEAGGSRGCGRSDMGTACVGGEGRGGEGRAILDLRGIVFLTTGFGGLLLSAPWFIL